MVSSLFYWVYQLFSDSIPYALAQTSTRLLFSFLTSLLLTILIGPAFIRWLKKEKMGQPIRDDKGFLLAELHKDKKNTPTMGGALIIFSVLASAIIWADWSSLFTLLTIGSLLVFGMVGAFDDWAKLKNKSSRGLPGKLRLALQTLWAVVVIFLLYKPHFLLTLGFSLPSIQDSGITLDWKTFQSGMYFPFLSDPLFQAAGFSFVFIWLLEWLTMVGCANAVNLTDGLDGLAAGLSMMAAFALMVVAFLMNHQELATHHTLIYVESSGEIAVLLAALIGACLGFLWFNSHPAEVFMGDTGSLAIGGMIGTSAVLIKHEWFLAIVGALFVFEALSVILQVLFFKRSGKRIFRCAPLHHHFEYGGLHEAKVVVRFWIVGLLFAALGIISLKFQ